MSWTDDEKSAALALLSRGVELLEAIERHTGSMVFSSADMAEIICEANRKIECDHNEPAPVLTLTKEEE